MICFLFIIFRYEGLFIGISILSFAENIELGLLILFHYLKKRKGIDTKTDDK